MATFIPSPQQARIFDWTKHGVGSAIIIAVAGAGKSTTLRKICGLIPATQSVVILSFNKKIADDMGEALKREGVGSNVRSATFHSYGFAAWRRVAPGVKLDEKKVQNILDEKGVAPEFHGFVLALVSFAKGRAVGVVSAFDNLAVWFEMVEHYDLESKLENVSDPDALVKGIKLAQATLRESVRRDREVVDFDDMLYAPLVHDVKMVQSDWVLVDEAQDTNPARRALAKKGLRPGGRLVAVGDPHQAIYGFTGADNDALDTIRQEFNAIDLPLTVTYRCPKAVVDVARGWVSHIEAHDSAKAGTYAVVDSETWSRFGAAEFTKDAAVLCRNTRPLVELAFSLIRRRIPCHVEGKEIGQGLLQLAKKWKSTKTIADLRDKLVEHLTKETERLLAKGQEAKLDALSDRISTLIVLMEDLADDDGINELAKLIADIFKDSPAPGITLSTIHKAKGREWKTVYWLGRAKYQPSPYARQKWQHDQERNLLYVAATRAMDTLIEAVVD